MSFFSRITRWRRSFAGPLVPARRAAPVPRDPALAESVEPRILYSADAIAGLLPAASSLVELDAVMPSEPSAEQTSMVLPFDAITAAARATELVFVDPGVPDAQRLVDAIAARRPDAAFHVIELDPNRDGLAQITEALAGQRQVAAIHIVSHGDPGAIELNGRRIDAAAIETDADQFTAWRAALGDQADLLIYGCDVAATPAGIAMLMRLAELTGADVAGSTDLTGSSDAGGDWTLEASIGAIQAGSLFADGDPAGWYGLLPAVLVFGPTTPVSLGAVVALDTTATPTMPSIPEGATNPSGITVTSIVVDGSITIGAAAAPEAIAIIALDTSLGTWQYSTDGGANWLTIDAEKINSSTNELALLLGPSASIRMLPFGDLNGTLNSAITFRAWCMATGATGDYVVITNPGDIALGSDFSGATDTASLTVTAVNDAPTFAPVVGTGKLMVPVGNSHDYGQSVVVQPDGKILVAGQSIAGNNDFSLIRLNADGTLDTTFDGDGKALVPVGSGIDVGYSLSLQPDGKIVVAGYSSNGINNDFSLIRLNANGSLDTSFNGDGKLIVPVGISSDYGLSLAVQPDGKMLVAGYSSNGIDQDFSLIRVNANGTLDTTFHGDGKLMVPVGNSDDFSFSLTVQSDGKILVAGYSFNGIDNDFSLIRLNVDGTFDTSFDGDGTLIVPLAGTADIAHSVTVQPDGKIVVAGTSIFNGLYLFSLIRLNVDGALDTTFNGDGTLMVQAGTAGTADIAYSLTVQPDGKILVAGASLNYGSGNDFSLIRVNADGTLDTTFDGDGKLMVPVGSGNDYGQSVVVQPDGKILVAGYSYNGTDNDFSLIRVNADGTLDTTFNGSATSTLGGSVSYTEGAAAVALDAGVAIYDADLAALNNGAGNYSGASISLSRNGGANAQDVFSALSNLSFTSGNAVLSGVTIGTVSNAAGTLSITFNSNATQARVDELLSSLAYANTSDAPPSSVQIVWTFSDGNASAQGSGGALTTQGTSTVNITAVNDPPVLDTTFSQTLGSVLEGATNPTGLRVSLLIWLGGGQVTDVDGAVAEAIAITALDTSLGTWQYSTDVGANWLTIDAAKINSSTNELALLLGPTAIIRMLPFGDLNGTLSTAITFRAWDMSSGATGDYTGITNPGTGSSAFSAASDTASLTVTAVNDAPTFAPVAGSGKLMVPVGNGDDTGRSVTVQPDGKILVAGYSSNGSNTDFSVIRLNADGSLDTTFDGDGKVIVPIGSGLDQSYSITIQPDGKILVAGYSANSSEHFSLIRLNVDGSLDTSFDGDGKLIVPVGSMNDFGLSVIVQPDGKIVVAGYSFNGTNDDFSLIRLNVNGSLDNAFGTNGKLLVPVGSGGDSGRSVTLQPDGKVLVAGFSFNGTDWDFSVIRLNGDGSLDTSFDGDGTRLVPVGSSNDIGFSVTVQLDGKILVAGTSFNGSNFDFSLIRLNADGSADTAFGTAGKLLVPVGSANDVGYSLTVQSDGRIIVAGSAFNGSNNDFGLIRLNADGSLDNTFGSNGKLIVAVGSSDDSGQSVTVQPDGKILMAGTSFIGSGNAFSLIRLNADGSLDTTFGGTAANTLGGSVSYTEGGAATSLGAGVAIYDADLAALNSGAGNYNGASVTLARSGGANAEDVFSALGNLSFTGGNAVLSGVTVGTVSNTAGTLSIIFNSNATQVRVNELLSSLAYANSSDAPPASVQIVWTFSDGNTSAQGSGSALTAQGTTTVNITSVNDSPVLDTAFSPTLGSVLEGATDPAGVTVSWLIDLTAGQATDADGSPVDAIAITTLDASLGTWQYRTDGGINWLTIDAAKINSTTNELALLLGPTASIRMLPFGELNGTLSTAITFRAWDMSSGATGDYTVITNPGTSGSAFSAASDTASLTVTAVNDAPTFARVPGSGKLMVPVGISADGGRSVTVQPDGKILVAGYAIPGGGWDDDFSVIRLNADGSLDTSFDGDGKVILPIGSDLDQSFSITIQPDGKILVAGVSFENTDDDFSLIRLNTDGSLDTSFNGDGRLMVQVSGGDTVYGLTVQSDGKILVAGYSTSNAGDFDFSLIRLNPNGTLDTTFNGDGKLIVPVGVSDDLGESLTVQPDGKILVAGFSFNGTSYDFSLIRLTANGTLDTTFDGDGKLIVPVGSGSGNDYGYSLSLQPDGKILVAGHSYNGADYDFSLIRLTANGTLDTTFDGDGKLIVPVGSGDDAGYSVTVQPDGKILVAGWSVNGTDYDFSLIRLTANGTLDTTFNGDGKLIVPVGSGLDYAYSLSLQPDGKIIVAGESSNGIDQDFSLIRVNADGSLDTTFNGAATNTLGGSVSYTEGAVAVALDAAVAIYDADLAALNNGAGNYSGASITLARNGGANAQDVFSARGNLIFASGDAMLSGVTIGTVTNAAGTLSIIFNSNATQARVNELLSSLAYVNSSDAPPASVQIVWTFSDGNTSAQGSGGALTAQGTSTVSITAVNDAPSGTSATLTTLEDTPRVLAAADFGFTDANDSPANAFLAVLISTLPTAGSLTLNGTAVTLGQSISVADINAGKLVFTPVSNANGNGNGYASFTFRVQDNGGTANGGVDLDPTAKTISFNVTPVNNAPVITSNGGGASAWVSLTENSTSVTQVTATDIDLPAQRLAYSIVGGADAARFVIDADTGLLSFVNAPRWHLPADANGDNRYEVIVGAGDGSLLTTQVLAITVTNLPDAPVVTAPPTATLLENTGVPIAGLGVSDVDGNLSTVSLRVQHGSLTLDLAGGAIIVAGEQGSSTITLGGNASQLQAALTSLSYRSVRDFHGSDTLQVLVTDATGLQAGASTAITITPINHLPEVNTPGFQATLAGMQLDFRAEGDNPIFISDIDDIEATLRVTLTVRGGSLLITSVDGLTLAPQLGAGGDSTLIIEGPMGAINAALATLSFLPDDDFFGESSLDLIVRDLTDPASGVDLSRSVPIEVSLPPTFAQNPISPIPVSMPPITLPPVTSTPVTSMPVGTTPVISTPVGSTPATSAPVGTTTVVTPPVGTTPIAAPVTASTTDASSGKSTARTVAATATAVLSSEEVLAPLVPGLISAAGTDRLDIAIRLIAPVEMALIAPIDTSASRRLESSTTVSTVVRALESQALSAGVFVVTPDSVSVIGLADDTRNSIGAKLDETESKLRVEDLEPTQTVGDELMLASLSVQSTAAAVSAGVLWWLVNGGTLLWIVLTYGPLARTFDPLPILARERRDDDEEDGLPDLQEPLDVPTLFDDPNAPSPAHTPVPDDISRETAAIVESA